MFSHIFGVHFFFVRDGSVSLCLRQSANIDLYFFFLWARVCMCVFVRAYVCDLWLLKATPKMFLVLFCHCFRHHFRHFIVLSFLGFFFNHGLETLRANIMLGAFLQCISRSVQYGDYLLQADPPCCFVTRSVGYRYRRMIKRAKP